MEKFHEFINLFGRHRYKVLMQKEGQYKGEIDCFCKSSEDGKYYTIVGYSSITNNYRSKKAHGKLDANQLRLAKKQFMYVQN